MNRRVGCLTVLVLLVAMPAWAYDGIVEKKTFAMPAYATVGGTTIKGVRVGYETYGTLNAARDNVILVAHFYSGNSHAAGKYAASDPAPGYWDAIIGSGKPVDTDRFFVVSSDTLVNLNVKDPKTITTGPASINSDTGRPYGMSFPIVTIRDFVNVQKALLDSLGIKKLHAVMGASGAFGRKWAAAERDPSKSWDNKFAIEDTLDKIALARARASDANSFLYLAKANQLFVTGGKGSLEEGLRDVKARVLLVPAKSDLLLFPDYSRQAMEILKRHGNRVQYFEIEGEGGHLDGVLSVAKAGEAIRKFLNE